MHIAKISSILDYIYPGLDPAVWGSDGKLLSEHKQTISTLITNHLNSEGLKDPAKWIKQVKLIGSLTTYQYAFDSDLDVHIVVDLPVFIQTNKLELSEEQAHQYLDEFRKRMTKAKTLVPGTQHPIEFYFETPFVNKKESPRTGVYDLHKEQWQTPAISIDKDFDIEEVKPFIVDLANQLAEELDGNLGTIKRDIRRVEELQHVMNAWDGEQRNVYQAKLQEKLDSIESEIHDLIQMKDTIVEERKDFNPEGDVEIKFKYLQKFGYFTIINALKEFLKDDQQVTVDEIPEIKKLINPISAQKDEYPGKNKLMIDFDQTIADNSKVEWPEIGEPMPDVKQAMDQLKADGWEITVYSCRANDKEGADQIKAFMEKHELPYDEIFIGKPHAEFYIDDKNILFTNWKDVINQVKPQKEAAFNPSITPHAPTNNWGPDDVVIPVDPDSSATEDTYDSPIVDKPRKRLWRKLLDFFIADEKLEEPETKTAKDTMPPTVTWTTNEDNLNWRYPHKFMKRPTGPAHSDENKVLKMLEDWDKELSEEDRQAYKREFKQRKAFKKFAKLLNSKDALEEVKTKSNPEIDKETALKWGNRAMAVYHRITSEEVTNELKLDWLFDSEDFYHESLEHAALVGDPEFFTQLQAELVVERQAAHDYIRNNIKTIKEASTYTDKEMDEIWTKQHEIHDSPTGDGGFTFRDWNHSTTDYPKPQDLRSPKVHLDLLDSPAPRHFPLSIPSYEVTWFLGMPQD